MKRAERREAEQKRRESKRPNQNKTPVFSELNPFLLRSAHADIKLPLSCLWSEGRRTVEKSDIILPPCSSISLFAFSHCTASSLLCFKRSIPPRLFVFPDEIDTKLRNQWDNACVERYLMILQALEESIIALCQTLKAIRGILLAVSQHVHCTYVMQIQQTHVCSYNPEMWRLQWNISLCVSDPAAHLAKKQRNKWSALAEGRLHWEEDCG